MKCGSKKKYAQGGKVNWSENEKLTKKTQDATEAGRKSMQEAAKKPVPKKYAEGGIVRGAGAATKGKKFSRSC
jgi:hypothetical protein